MNSNPNTTMNPFVRMMVSLAVGAMLVAPVAQAKDKAKDQLAEIQKLEQQWLDAYVKSDVAALEKIEADDFILHDPAGAVKTKAEDLRDVKSGAFKWTDAQMEDLKVRFYGKTAVATGVAVIKGSVNGQDISGKYRFTDVFIRKADEWRAVSSQLTPVTEKK